jgi:hypothetical protein
MSEGEVPAWWNDAANIEKSVAEARTALPFVEPDLAVHLNAFIEANGDIVATAKAQGVPIPVMFARLTEATRKAAKRGLYEAGDMTTLSPPGFHIKGVSTYYNVDPKTGEKTLRAQWVKSKMDPEDRLARLSEALHAMCEPLKGTQDPVVKPDHVFEDDLLALYPMGDPHIGMYAWHEETGEDFDLDICEANIRSAIDKTVAQAPPAKRALFIPLGDNFHSDNQSNTTARSGHALDVDDRWSKVLRVGIDAMRWCIDRMLRKHEFVDVIVVIGNHDDHSAIFLSIALEMAYEREPRVNVIKTTRKFHYYRFGRCLLGMTHGDTVKPAKMGAVMAVDAAVDWGETRYRHVYAGHVHHNSVIDLPGVTVETMRVLAPGDAWHHNAGYRSDRDMRCDVWHAEFGMINRHIVGIERITGRHNLDQRVTNHHKVGVV